MQDESIKQKKYLYVIKLGVAEIKNETFSFQFLQMANNAKIWKSFWTRSVAGQCQKTGNKGDVKGVILKFFAKTSEVVSQTDKYL